MMKRTAYVSVIVVAAVLLMRPDDAMAQQNAIRVLEEEINLLKETIEQQNRAIRKLRERVGTMEKSVGQRDKAISDLRRRLARIDVFQKELQGLEAKLAEAIAGGGVGAKGGDASAGGLSAEVRIRPEFTQNRNDLNSDADDQDGFWGHRVRLGAKYGFSDWVRALVVVQESRSFGSTTTAGGGELGIHEGFIELTPPLLPGLRIRLGRTELSYGGERLIGRDDFSRAGTAFDGGIIRWGHLPWFDIEAFYAKIHESRLTDGDTDFFGAYMTTEAVPNTTIEAYYMGLLTEQVVVQQDAERKREDAIHTLGVRAEAVVSGLRIDGEAVVQLGSRTDPADLTKELDHFATAFFAELSYQIPIKTSPTLGGFFVYASGDANPTDSKSVNFQPLFPTRHSFLGTMDLFSWSNIMDVGGMLELTPPAGFGFFAAFHYYLQVQRNGGLQGPLGGSITPTGAESNGKKIGYEIDAALSWAPNDHLQLQLGYSIFMPSTVPEQLKIGSDSAQWAYLQARVRY